LTDAKLKTTYKFRVLSHSVTKATEHPDNKKYLSEVAMKNLVLIMLSLFFSLFLKNIPAFQQEWPDQVQYYKVSYVKIFINDRCDINKLREQGIVIEQVKMFENYFETYMDSVQIEKLKLSRYQFEILIDDVTKDYLERTKKSREKIKLKKIKKLAEFEYGSMGGFYTFSEVVAQLDDMRTEYPNLITEKDSIGSSIEGRTIWAVKISDNPDMNENEPQVFYNSLIHAREPAGMMSVIYFMYYLLENYGTDPEVTYLVDNREFYFVPVINPDGYVYNEAISPDGGGMWRKNLRDNDTNNIINSYDGVDLARNFSYMWGYDNIGSSPNPVDWNYRGTEPFSESECQVLRDFILSKNFKIVHNFHSYWNVIFTPWGYNMLQTPDSAIYNSIITLATQFSGYKNGNYISDAYPCNGYPCDWIYGEQTIKPKIFSFLTEVGNDNDGFWPIPERILPLAEENCYSNKILAWGPGVIDQPPYISEAEVYPSYCSPSVDSFHINATELNPENYNSVVTAYLYDINDNLMDEFEMSEISTNAFYATCPVPQEENFYYLLLKDEGVEIPSNFYYKQNLKFTTSGPVVLDSITYTIQSIYYRIKTFLKNLSNTVTIPNAAVILKCDDPWLQSISPTTQLNLGSIAPGATVSNNTTFMVRAIDSLFPGYFNFKVEVLSDGWTYWTDSMQVIVTGIDGEETLPTEFTLDQNYPNPFNPSTTISWQSPVGSHQTIKVFDILGNEIATLVDEYKPAGRYEVEFNAERLVSGIYFYQLKAGEFLQTRKMLLIK